MITDDISVSMEEGKSFFSVITSILVEFHFLENLAWKACIPPLLTNSLFKPNAMVFNNLL
jgi:hypothetical protein